MSTPEKPRVPINAIHLLDAAAGHMRDRAATYDKPEGERSMAQTVTIFNQFHGASITEAQGWHLMQILKDVRLFAREGYHGDSAEDCVAYAALKAEAKAKEVATDMEWIFWEPTIRWPRPNFDRNALVRIRLRDGNETPADTGLLARALEWRHSGGSGDIIAYTLLK